MGISIDLGDLLSRRVERPVSAPIDEDTADLWCETFNWTRSADRSSVPSLAYPTFLRPGEPSHGAMPTGVVLHDELKVALGLPMAIAVGYELELHGEPRCGQRLQSVERIGALGEERETSLGFGREWIIEVLAKTTENEPVGIERFRMLGYQPRMSGRTTSQTSVGNRAAQWTEEFPIDAASIRRSAGANRVWAPAHHDRDAARLAGLSDIILDTSSQVALLTSAARRRRSNAEPLRVTLTMRRPVVPGSRMVISGFDDGEGTTVWAELDERETSRATITFEG